MPNLNSNDYRILENVRDTEHDRGLARGRGSTIAQIKVKTGFSDMKVRRTVKVLIEMKLIEEGIKKVKAKAYCLTEKGLQELVDLRKNISI